MKVFNYCFSCNKEHDVTNDNFQYGLTCECGGYYVTPSGKTMTKLIPETDEDYKTLGIKKKIKVWTIYLDGDRGWTTENPDTFKYEFELDEEIDKGSIDNLIIMAKSLDYGESLSIGKWTIKCEEIESEKFNNLSEFEGW